MSNLNCRETCLLVQRLEFPCATSIALAGENTREEGPGPDPRLVCVNTISDLGTTLAKIRNAQSFYYTAGQKSAYIWLKFLPDTKDFLVAKIANGEVEYF